MNPGIYIGTVLRTEYGHSEQKGTPRFRVFFQVEVIGGFEQIHGDIYLTDKAMGMARKSLKAIGFDPDTQDLDVLVADPALLGGKQASIQIDEEMDNKGNPRLKVSYINPVPKPPAKDELKKLSQALREVKKKTGNNVEIEEEEKPLPF